MASLAVLILVLWLPGLLLRRGFSLARGSWGAGRFAVESSLSLAFLTVALLPLYLARAPVAWAPPLVFGATIVLAFVAERRARTLPRLRPRSAADRLTSGATAAELGAFAFALVLLLPAVLRFSGGNVDDWWDLSFVRGWLADGRFSFSQMALSADPDTGASPWHPRFLWSVWLTMQALVLQATSEEAWRMQATSLAAVTAVLVVSAQAALARALFRGHSFERALVAATLVATAAWIWGTDSLPLFLRGYQDKLVAAFVAAPVLLALVLDAIRREPVSPPSPAWSVAAAAVAAVSVHSLVYTMAVAASAALVVALRGRGALRWLREHPGIVAALALPCLWPLVQASVLALVFGEQGVSLAMPDNPVVRAHLSLGRLVATVTPAWVVHPAAVFGLVAFPALVSLAIAWRRRRGEPARALLALALLPAVLLFVPGVAALAGKLWVPWMLYRFGWLVPVAPLVAYGFVLLWNRARESGRRPVAATLFAVVVVVASLSTARDRLRRDMNEHPGPRRNVPVAGAAGVMRFLSMQPGRDPVFAPPSFSELVPALGGKPVVAFAERGTLVFAGDDRKAYERLRDRAIFFSRTSSRDERREVAERYGVRWAVLPRRLVASGSEESWLWRFGPEALIAARRFDAAQAPAWWSATAESTAAGLGPPWRIVFETRDWFVVEREDRRATSAASRAAGAALAVSDRDGSPMPVSAGWLEPFGTLDEALPATAGAGQPGSPALEVLASATAAPGAIVAYDPPPQFSLPSVAPIWLDGPGAWEDTPADATVTLDLGVRCRIDAVELVPHLPRSRREVLELRIDGETRRYAPKHNVPLRVPVRAREPRSRIEVGLASLLGSGVSVADIRALGDPRSCEPRWPAHKSARSPQMAASASDLLALAAARPESGRLFVSLARRAHDALREDARIALLEEATRRQGGHPEAWLELGFARQAAAERETGDAKRALHAAAREAFRSGVGADSHSAWARGSFAWQERLSGRAPLAIWHALVATQVDPLYGDAWTILGYALGDLGLHALGERALAVAMRDDPERNWPVLAKAELAAKRGDSELAKKTLRDWIRAHPFDGFAREQLSALTAKAGTGPNAEPPPAAGASAVQ